MTQQNRGRRIVALTAAIAAGAIVVPSSASAAYTGAVSGSTATFTGDAASDVLLVGANAAGLLTHNAAGFNSATDFDSAAAGDQTLPGRRHRDAQRQRRRGRRRRDGDSQPWRPARPSTARAATTRSSRAAASRTCAAGTATTASSPARATTTWRAGRATTSSSGTTATARTPWTATPGFDEIEVNGAATAADTFTIVPNAARVKFDRTNLVPFTLDIGRLGAAQRERASAATTP
jgi:hypothetical protein